MKKNYWRSAILVAMIVAFAHADALAQAQATLDPALVPKFLNNMPVIRDAGLRVDMTAGGSIRVQMVETQQDLLGLGTLTKVWGYKFPGLPPSYPGATIVAEKDNPVSVRWENALPAAYDAYPATHLLPVDTSIYRARTLQQTGVPLVTHLHGGHTESASDGLPEAWFTRNFRETGIDFVKPTYTYHNDQRAATLWYHDHALGITRLNVYAGLAGFYLLRDRNEAKLNKNNVLPSKAYEIEVVIQDRMFTANTHQLYYPAFEGDPPYQDFITGEGATPPAGAATIFAEFFGNIILVNGKAWPKLDVEPRKYRIRLLNGSDSRFYVLSFRDQLPWFQIGTDNGFLASGTDIPDPVSEPGGELVIGPGERMDLILDFTGKAGQEFLMWNYGPDEPFGGDVDTDLTRPTAQIMKFVVSKPLNNKIPNATVTVGTALDPTIPAIPADYVAAQQNLVLFEGNDQYGRLMPMLGTIAAGSQTFDHPITENPQLNETQVWEIFNATADAHPIHLHLVAFQVLGRGAFTATVTPRDQVMHDGSIAINGGRDFTLTSRDSWRGPEANEMGWKDTHIVYPGEFSQVRATFDRAGLYVWHCHILSHEDHEMMRHYYVGPMPAPAMLSTESTLVQNAPNPFATETKFFFEIQQQQEVQLVVYDQYGMNRYQYADTFVAGKHALFWDGRDNNGNLLPDGVYSYQLVGDNFKSTERLVISR